MKSDGTIEIPATGQARLGDWRARANERLHLHGFQSFAALARSAPTASLIELAVLLSTVRDIRINYSDIAADQVACLWLEEANSAGPEAVEYMACRVFVGELHKALPEGWFEGWPVDDPAGVQSPMWRLIEAFTTWSGALGRANEPACYRIFAAFKDRALAGTIPAGWLPSDVNDPLVVELVAENWRRPA
jgi:hypothetical protein